MEEIYLHKLSLRDIKPTAMRLLILRTMMEMKRAVSVTDLEDKLDTVDKSTIFRTLTLHMHFYCEQCHKTYCIRSVHAPTVNLPEGFMQTGINYVIKGICADCAVHQKIDTEE